MQPFTKLTGLGVPIDEPNVDTNQLCPTRFNKVPRGPGHARILFHDMRFNADGSEKDFILNREPYRKAQIIVADRNWGCGSARESAVEALYEFGIRCIIASSFGDIHFNNCFKVGVLPVVLSGAECVAIRKQLHENVGATLSVDLEAQTVTDVAGEVHRFEIHPVQKKCLLEGLDDIGRTEQYRESFDAFENKYQAARPWLFARWSDPVSSAP
jgi:3-isopropylmalate/(R)-2-methylmalate dehydratase small subunit